MHPTKSFILLNQKEKKGLLMKKIILSSQIIL